MPLVLQETLSISYQRELTLPFFLNQKKWEITQYPHCQNKKNTEIYPFIREKKIQTEFCLGYIQQKYTPNMDNYCIKAMQLHPQAYLLATSSYTVVVQSLHHNCLCVQKAA